MQAKIKLTEKIIAGLPAPVGKPYAVTWDSVTASFGVRVMAKGTRSYVVGYRLPGRPYTLRAIDDVRQITLEVARKIAKGWLGDVAKGLDPQAGTKAQERKEETKLGNILAEGSPYAQHLGRRVNGEQQLRILRLHLRPFLQRSVLDITRADLTGQLDIVAKGYEVDGRSVGGEGAGRDVFRLTQRMLDWCIEQFEEMPRNVLDGSTWAKESLRRRPVKQGRALEAEEIVRLWKATHNPEICEPRYGALVRLLLLTGMRKGEAAALTHAMVGTYKGTEAIILPPEVTKQGRQHELAITDMIRAEIGNGEGVVFPTSTGLQRGWWSDEFEKLAAGAELRNFTLHDLRRTFVTMMGQQKVLPHIAEATLGHSVQGMPKLVNAALREVYNFHDSWEERVDAISRVSRYVAGLVSPQLTLVAA